jgi:hypothetical protein
MPCIAPPALPGLPSLPAGVSLPVFPGLTLPSLGLCCKIRLPSFPVPPIALTIAFPSAVITALNGYLAAAEALYDMLEVPCPNE